MALLAKKDLHGYHILELLKKEVMFREQPPDQTGVYRILKSMEQEDLVACDWELQNSGPARKRYRITTKGRSCLLQWRSTLVEYSESVASIIALLDKAIGET